MSHSRDAALLTRAHHLSLSFSVPSPHYRKVRKLNQKEFIEETQCFQFGFQFALTGSLI